MKMSRPALARVVSRLMSDVGHDVVFGLRLIRRSPGFTSLAVLTLTVAIGANTAVFSVVNALIFSPLPVLSADAVMRVRPGESTMSWLNYQDLRRRNDMFSDMAVHRNLVLGLAVGDKAVRMMGESTSLNFFSLLGSRASIGRTYAADEARDDVVVLANHIWRNRFATDPKIVGRVLQLGGRSYEVVGVMPREFRGVRPPGLRPDFWVPVSKSASNRLFTDRAFATFEVIGRLKPGIGTSEATAGMRLLAQQLRTEYPQIPERFLQMEVFSVEGFGAFSGMSGLLIPILAFLTLLIVVTACVLCIACANIASVLVGKNTARAREIALRMAIGASGGRLTRQLLTESLILALLGGAGGVLLARWLTQFVNVVASRLPYSIELDAPLDWRMLLYTAGVTSGTTLLCGLLPAKRAARHDLVSALKDEGARSLERHRLLRALVIGQVAVCTGLLFWSGLFFRSLGRIADVDPGFNASGVLIANVEVERGTMDDEGGERLFLDLQRRIDELPGVQSSGLASIVPLAMRGREEFYVTTDDERRLRQRVYANRVTAGWFRTLQIRVLAGRDFTPTDRAGSPAVIVINETLAKQLWNGNALGQRIAYGGLSREIVGIVSDSKYATLGETIQPTVYQPFQQAYTWSMTLHVRAIDMTQTAVAMEQEMPRLIPDVPVDISSMADAVAVAVLPARVGAIATGVLGIVAVLLALLGVYGLVSYVVGQRTPEIGVRRALGARDADIVVMIVGSTIRVTVTGLAIGVVLGGLGAFALRGFIFDVSPLDGPTLAMVIGVVVVVTAAASVLPTLRSIRLDPLIALRRTE
jgi:predicted permease